MSDQFLSQEEVDALLEGVNGDASGNGTQDPPGTVKSYDIAKQERIVRGRMPTLEIVNERFARNLRVGLFNFMHRNPEISVGQAKVQKYSAFLRNLVVPTNINIMQVRPLRGSGLLICEPNLVFTIIDSLFGGSGLIQARVEGREFSPTEQRIIQRIVEVVCEEYAKAWQGIYPLELEYVRSEMHTQFANIATPSEIMVTTSFDVEIGESGGSLHFCIPYSTLEPIRDTLYSAGPCRPPRRGPPLGHAADAADPGRRGRPGRGVRERQGDGRAADLAQARRLHRTRPAGVSDRQGRQRTGVRVQLRRLERPLRDQDPVHAHR